MKTAPKMKRNNWLILLAIGLMSQGDIRFVSAATVSYLF